MRGPAGVVNEKREARGRIRGVSSSSLRFEESLVLDHALELVFDELEAPSDPRRGLVERRALELGVGFVERVLGSRLGIAVVLLSLST